MQIELEARPSYALAVVTLGKGEKLIVESSSMVGMSTGLEVDTTFNGANGGGLVEWLTAAFVGLVRKFVAGETMFVNEYRAKADGQQVLVAPAMVGDLVHVPLDGTRKVVVQASSFVACTPGVKQRLIFGGLSMLFSGEGAFFLECSGKGELLFNSYGGLEEVALDQPYVVDSGHVAAWEGDLTYTLKKAGGWGTALVSGEGFVLEFKPKANAEKPPRVWLQTRNLQSLVGWISPYFH
jgi:uncharacterized protein (TIGR00266 family)